MSINKLFENKLNVVNIGLSSFKEALDNAGAKSVQVDWRPPLDIDPDLLKKLKAKLPAIEEANKEAIDRILRGHPFLVGLAKAIEVIPNMHENLILHAGPPITWDRMCGPVRGAIVAALIYEGKAKTKEEAEALAGSGKIKFAPCHEHQTVGPMAGIVSASMPVFMIKNATFGNLAFCTMNEGLGKVLRFGAFGPEVIERLKWMEKTLYPALKKAIAVVEKIDLKNIIAQALHMGDEVHNRNRAATSLLYRMLAPLIVKTCDDKDVAIKVLEFISGNDHFFLNLSMPAAKSVLDSARNIENSSLVVAMCRNGVEFGIQVAGTKNQWFTGPASIVDALFFPGFTKEDANPDLGDSAITEPYGLGGTAIAAAPAIVQFIGGNVSDAMNYTKLMYEITVTESNAYQIPYLNFRGTPTGIDIIKIIEKNILPVIDTGVAHKDAGVGQIGAGLVRPPVEPFKKAFTALVS